MKWTCKLFFTAALLFTWAFAGCANHIPELLPIGNQSVNTGVELKFDINAKDDDGDPLQFAVSDKPGEPGAARFDQIDNNKAVFSWTPLASDAGPQGKGEKYQVTFLVTDGIDTSSEVITISVTLGGGGAGSPVFISRPDHTLDLDRTNEISFNIEVRDADSANITLKVVDGNGIDGGEFSSPSGSKTAAFKWKPTEEQINEKPVWGIRVGARDESNPEVFRDITILIKGGKNKCEGTPPTVEHKSLSDQRGSEDYVVEITAKDKESEVSVVALYWQLDTGGGGAFQKTPMTATGDDKWQVTITNPKLDEGKTATIRYYICVWDNDDPSKSDCDMRSCIPEEGRLAFTAYPADSNECADDEFESNDSSDSATEVTFDSNGEFYNESLNICPANVDYYRINMSQNHEMAAGISYTEANGELQMDLLDSDGSTILAAGEDYIIGNGMAAVIVESGVSSQGQDVYLRVKGADAQVANNCVLEVVHREFVHCDDDRLEDQDGNDTVATAKLITAGSYPDLTCCGDQDYYKMDLIAGDKLEVSMEFIHREYGDLDLWIFDAVTLFNAEELNTSNAAGYGITETDDEKVTVGSIPADGFYYIIVEPFAWAKNTYNMTVAVTPQGQECQDDDYEEDDDSENARKITNPENDHFLCPNDEDWYWVYFDEVKDMVVKLTFTHYEDRDLDVKVYAPEVTPDTLWEHCRASGVSTDDNELIEYTTETSGNHYIRVYCGSRDQVEKAPYAIEVD